MLASFRHMKFLNSSIINKNLIQALNNKYQLILTRNKNTFICREHFEVRHNGINQKDQEEMLKVINVKVNLINCFLSTSYKLSNSNFYSLSMNWLTKRFLKTFD